MNSSKSEDSILPSEFSHKPEPESPQKMLARAFYLLLIIGFLRTET